MTTAQPFEFKQFTIQQQHAAMKIGTDGVLLGAWFQPPQQFMLTPTDPALVTALSILDIGTGTGVIALMAAQRFAHAQIDAIEIDRLTSAEARENARQSIFSSRIQVYCADLNVFSPNKTYQAIVCNPPFYTDNSNTTLNSRRIARQVTLLSFNTLLAQTAKLLEKTGTASFIIPFSETQAFCEMAQKHGLLLQRATYVKGTAQSAFKRSLLCFTFEPCQPEVNELVLEIKRHTFTAEHLALVQPFYLKL